MGTVNEFAGFLSGDGLNPNGMNNKDAQENNEQRVDFLAAQKEQRDVSWQLGGKRKSKGEKCEEQNSGGCASESDLTRPLLAAWSAVCCAVCIAPSN